MRRLVAWSAVALIGLSLLNFGAPAQEREQAAKSNGQRQSGGMFPGLIEAIKSTPGCLGVETAGASSGKRLVFAWFKDKKACLDWYNSEFHQAMMDRFFPGDQRIGPLVGVPDDIGPIMAIASITPTEKAQLKPTSLPISQISIELYSPVKGGLSLGGSFAPEALKVDGMRNYSLPK